MVHSCLLFLDLGSNLLKRQLQTWIGWNGKDLGSFQRLDEDDVPFIEPPFSSCCV